MSHVKIDFTSAHVGFPIGTCIEEGKIAVSYTLPPGCVFMKSSGDAWSQCETASPFVHSGADCGYRIDCVTYTEPVTATLHVEKP